MFSKSLNLIGIVKVVFFLSFLQFFPFQMLYAETINTKSLFFFDDALKIDVSGNTSAKEGTFLLKILDPSTDMPWTDLSAIHFEGAVEMTNMNMGTTQAQVSDIEPGVLKMTAKFSMRGPWRLNITIKPVGTTPETKSIEFNVN